MTTESVMRDAANRAYITAFLLCGGAERAEAAVQESIRLMNPDVASGEELFRGAVHAAIELEDIAVHPWSGTVEGDWDGLRSSEPHITLPYV